ncbi:MAG: hypothetical protein QM714_10965 [Nocardioides sp.]|uniref:hypothetical protein n=1 Tax=Nocardioides sp. TaxID=35761 RepID=UPI0039E39B28
MKDIAESTESRSQASKRADYGEKVLWCLSEMKMGEAADVPLTVVLMSFARPTGAWASSVGRSTSSDRLESLVADDDACEVLVGLQSGDSEARLSATRALRELVEIEQIRAALNAERDGRTQREIGRLLGVSQTEVHRMLRRAKNAGTDWVRVAPRELILRYRAGLISRGTLLGRLNGIEEGQVAPHSGDGYTPGAWDQVRDAFMDGLLTEDEYEELRKQSRSTNQRAAAPAGPQRATEQGGL